MVATSEKKAQDAAASCAGPRGEYVRNPRDGVTPERLFSHGREKGKITRDVFDQQRGTLVGMKTTPSNGLSSLP